MKADAVPLLELFEKKMRLEVPLFQRQYVWSRDAQWEPLWEDISRKFTEFLEGRKDAPVHFLGAMVLDQKQTPSTHVERRQVIDGQQRLTTLQIFLSAFRDFCREQACEELANEFDGYTANKGKMADPEVDKFKVWPTQLDRGQFTDVVGLGSREAIEKKHPIVRRKYSRYPEPRPRMVEAYVFFSDEIREYFLGTEQEPAVGSSLPLETRIDEAFQALKNALQVAVIDLETGDDAQVIFETLNARGEPLLPADLLRNYIFLRAGRLKEPQEELYEKYWRGFDEEFWRVEVKQGRLQRPRSDLFMQHFLSSRQFVDIPIKHLFVEYRFWIEREKPFDTVTKELATLARQREDFRRILDPQKSDTIYDLATFLERFDIRTAYPLLLFMLDEGLSDGDWRETSTLLESYLLRRAVVGWSTKSYNKIFLALAKNLKRSKVTPGNLRAALTVLQGESSAWPTDAAFYGAWMTRPSYSEMNNSKMVHILKRLNESFLDKKNETILIEGPLTVEHILPQNWIEHWPLSGGETGMSWEQITRAEEGDSLAEASKARHQVLNTFGNLTILTQELNSSVSNAAWETKKPALLGASLLPINQNLHSHAEWNEETIEKRGKELFARATKIWPGPSVGQ
jgi:uncharacterized protein with ParB-like and HNH nuclease domain